MVSLLLYLNLPSLPQLPPNTRTPFAISPSTQTHSRSSPISRPSLLSSFLLPPFFFFLHHLFLPTRRARSPPNRNHRTDRHRAATPRTPAVPVAELLSLRAKSVQRSPRSRRCSSSRVAPPSPPLFHATSSLPRPRTTSARELQRRPCARDSPSSPAPVDLRPAASDRASTAVPPPCSSHDKVEKSNYGKRAVRPRVLTHRVTSLDSDSSTRIAAFQQ